MRSKNAIKVSLFREKNKVNPAPPIPKAGDFASFMSITFPEKFAKTHDGAEFLRMKCWTNDDEDQAMLVFISDTGAHVLRTHKVWLLDGTFSTAPAPFSQVYVVMCVSENGGQGLPCGFCLLPNKNTETYELMLTKLFEIVGVDNVLTTVVCDFEQSIWKALRSIAPPGLERRGCQFHFRKAVYTKLGDLGLQSFYNVNVEFNELVHRIYALSFVPLANVVQFYEDFVVLYIEKKLDSKADTGNPTWIESTVKFEDLVDYLDRTWVGKDVPSRGGDQPTEHNLYMAMTLGMYFKKCKKANLF